MPRLPWPNRCATPAHDVPHERHQREHDECGRQRFRQPARPRRLQHDVARQQQIRGPDRRGENADGEIPNCSHKSSPRRVVTSNSGDLRRRRGRRPGDGRGGDSGLEISRPRGLARAARAPRPARPPRRRSGSRRGPILGVAGHFGRPRRRAGELRQFAFGHGQRLRAERFLIAHPE